MLDDHPFVIMGHCRFATHGAVNIANTHPFSCGHLIGAHNGVMNHMYDKKNDITDSKVLYTKMNKEGVEKGIKEGLNGGNLALVYFNKSDSTLNFFRDDAKPLFMGKQGKKIFWASEKDMLEACERRKLLKFDEIFMLKSFIINKVSLKNLTLTLQEIEKPVQKSFLPATYKHPSNTDWIYDSYPPRERNFAYAPRDVKLAEGGYSRKCVKVGPVVLTPASDNKKDTPRIRYRGYLNKIWDLAYAHSILHGKGCGCDMCGQRPHSLLRKVHFFDEKGFLCDKCYNDDKLIETCYQGTHFYTGGMINKDGKFVVEQYPPKKKDDKAMPF